MTLPYRTLILWDVDHTLIENSGVSKETYARAFERLTGEKTQSIPETDGRTDFEIIRNLLRVNGIDDSGRSTSVLRDALVGAMKDNWDKLKQRGYPLPGAEVVLEALSDDIGVVQSVLSGNIAFNAEAKLTAFGLDRYLDLGVGGFGSDDTVRAHLVDVSRRKVHGKYGWAFDRDSTVLIGDTIRDVRAGKDGGALVLAVATGIDSIDKLNDAGADAVLADLTDVDLLFETLTRLRQGTGSST